MTTFAYDAQGRVSTITDPAGRVTTLSHDAVGNLTAVDFADQTRQTFAYDLSHRLIERTDARGAVAHYTYDYAGRVSQATLPTGETRTLTPTQTIAVPNLAAGEGTPATPAPLGQPINTAAFTDGRNTTTTFELDGLDRIIQQTDALTRTTRIDRDPQGNPTKITRPNGAVTTMTYDPKGNLLTSTEPAIAATTTFAYEPAFNQVTSITDPLNHTTTITYDVKGNPLTITDAYNKVGSDLVLCVLPKGGPAWRRTFQDLTPIWRDLLIYQWAEGW